MHPQWFKHDLNAQCDAHEGEGLDRHNITLPEVHTRLLKAITAVGIPVVVVLIDGGTVACLRIKANAPAVIGVYPLGPAPWPTPLANPL